MATVTTATETLDGHILNLVQQGFPLVSRPYAEIARRAGSTEREVLDCLQRMQASGVLRQISAIWDTQALGYQSMLVAAKVADDRIDEAAAVINTHPGVSHNYRRNHEFNLWFTLAVPMHADLEWSVQRLGRLADAISIRMLPTLRLFKIGVTLDMTGDRELTRHATPVYSDVMRTSASGSQLTPLDKQLVRLTQEDLPIIERPFAAIAEAAARSESDLFARLRRLQATGHLRRFAAILRHRRAGFSANAMAVWAVPDERVVEVGELMASYEVVSHCYQRPTHPDWPYNIFTMIHARTPADSGYIVGALETAAAVHDYALLYSSVEYKKTRLRYFTDELDGWEDEQRALERAEP